MEKARMTMSIQEVAEQMGVSMPTAYGLTKIIGFPSFRVGRRVLVPTDAFREWLNETALRGKGMKERA